MRKTKKTNKLPLLRPGEYLRSVLEDAGLSANSVALAFRVPASRLTEILNGRRAITADTAMRLGRYFGTSAQMWTLKTRRHNYGMRYNSAIWVDADPG